MRWWGWTLVAVVAIAAMAAFFTRPRAEAESTASAAILPATVQEGPFSREVQGSGEVTAEEFTLKFPTTEGRVGTIKEVYVEVADKVEAGQLLAEYDTQDIEESLAGTRARLAQAEADCQQKLVQYQNSRRQTVSQLDQKNREVELYRNLVAIGAANQSELATKELEARTLQDELIYLDSQQEANQKIYQAEVQTQQAQITSYNNQLADAKLVAPVTGEIAEVTMREGQPWTEGQIILIEAGSLRVEAQIPENQAGDVTLGQKARVVLDSAPEGPLSAKVSRITPKALREGAAATLPVELELDQPGPARPGFSATVYITTFELDKASLVPVESLAQDAEGSFLWVLEGEPPVLNKHPVEVLGQSPVSNQAAVQGIEPGTEIVRIPTPNLQAGMPAEVMGGRP